MIMHLELLPCNAKENSLAVAARQNSLGLGAHCLVVKYAGIASVGILAPQLPNLHDLEVNRPS